MPTKKAASVKRPKKPSGGGVPMSKLASIVTQKMEEAKPNPDWQDLYKHLCGEHEKQAAQIQAQSQQIADYTQESANYREENTDLREQVAQLTERCEAYAWKEKAYLDANVKLQEDLKVALKGKGKEYKFPFGLFVRIWKA